MTILELREARNKAWEGAKAFVESKRDKDGLLSKEDAETYNSMEEKIKNYSKEIERMEAMENMENELNKPVNTPIVTRPSKVDNEVKTGRASNEYKDAMLNALRSNFRQVSNVLQEGVDADGGYLVPDEYDTRLIQKLEENNIVRSLSTIIKTSGEHKINIASTTPAAAWIEEGGTLTFGDSKFDQKILDAHKLHVAVKVTEELLYDNAFGLENFLIDSFGKAIGNAEENAFLNGTGTGQPTGIFATTGGGTYITAKTKGADAIIELVYNLKRPYRKNASFIMNDKMIATITHGNFYFLSKNSTEVNRQNLNNLVGIVYFKKGIRYVDLDDKKVKINVKIDDKIATTKSGKEIYALLNFETASELKEALKSYVIDDNEVLTAVLNNYGFYIVQDKVGTLDQINSSVYWINTNYENNILFSNDIRAEVEVPLYQAGSVPISAPVNQVAPMTDSYGRPLDNQNSTPNRVVIPNASTYPGKKVKVTLIKEHGNWKINSMNYNY